MISVYLLIGISVIVMGASALIALAWAAKDGQFKNYRKGANSIFDEEEPIGKPTGPLWKSRAEKKQERQQLAADKK